MNRRQFVNEWTLVYGNRRVSEVNRCPGQARLEVDYGSGEGTAVRVGAGVKANKMTFVVASRNGAAGVMKGIRRMHGGRKGTTVTVRSIATSVLHQMRPGWEGKDTGLDLCEEGRDPANALAHKT